MKSFFFPHLFCITEAPQAVHALWQTDLQALHNYWQVWRSLWVESIGKLVSVVYPEALNCNGKIKSSGHITHPVLNYLQLLNASNFPVLFQLFQFYNLQIW